MLDYYQLLGVPRDATALAIKRAYKGLAKKLHPDKFVAADKAEMARINAEFLKLKEAYETLFDAGRRAAYDRKYPEAREMHPFRSSATAGESFEPLFSAGREAGFDPLEPTQKRGFEPLDEHLKRGKR